MYFAYLNRFIYYIYNESVQLEPILKRVKRVDHQLNIRI